MCYKCLLSHTEELHTLVTEPHSEQLSINNLQFIGVISKLSIISSIFTRLALVKGGMMDTSL